MNCLFVSLLVAISALQSTLAADFDCSLTKLFQKSTKEKVVIDETGITAGEMKCENFIATFDAETGDLTYRPKGAATSRGFFCFIVCMYWGDKKRSSDSLLEPPYCHENHEISEGGDVMIAEFMQSTKKGDEPLTCGFGFKNGQRIRCMGKGMKAEWKAGVLSYTGSK